MRYRNKRCQRCGKLARGFVEVDGEKVINKIHRVVIMRKPRKHSPSQKQSKMVLFLCTKCRERELEKTRRTKSGKVLMFNHHH